MSMCRMCVSWQDSLIFFFFFQAEDGIRDLTVTGVQTCALPILLGDAIDHLVDGRRVVQPTLITALLNGDTNGFFYAHVKREHGEDLMFMVDPDDDEQVSLLRGGREGLKVQTVAEFRRAEDLKDTTTTDP